ncbi:hypothetical protein NPIL_90491, partial [Nephila pilipes]
IAERHLKSSKHKKKKKPRELIISK